MKYFFSFILIVLLLGCGRDDGSHLPTIWQLPGAAIGTSVDNAIYNSKRKKLKKYIIEHYDDLNIETKNGYGPHLNKVLSILKVKENKRQLAIEQLQKDHNILFKNIVLITEDMMNRYAFIYISTSSKKTKTINGFSYQQASNIIKDYLILNFDIFKKAIQDKDSLPLQELLKQLNIKTEVNKKIFLEYIFQKYDDYFVEPVVVGFIAMSYF